MKLEFSGKSRTVLADALGTFKGTVTVTETGIDFNVNIEGQQCWGTFVNGVLQFRTTGYGLTEAELTGVIRRAYAKQSIVSQAKKRGWIVKQDQKNPLKLQIIRR
jgi:hypothetical protein